MMHVLFFFSSRRRHTRCALVTGVQMFALPISSRFADRVFRRGLGFGIGPAGRDWTILLNAFAGSAGLMDQHRSRIDELLDLEWLERPHEVAAAVDIDGLILRLVLAAEVEEGRQMHDARDAATVFRTYPGKGIGDARQIGRAHV